MAKYLHMGWQNCLFVLEMLIIEVKPKVIRSLGRSVDIHCIIIQLSLPEGSV